MRQYKDVYKTSDEPELHTDPRYLTNELRVRNRVALIDILKKKMKTKTMSEWNSVFASASFPFGAVNSLKGVFEDEHVRHVGMLRDCKHDALGSVKQARKL